MTRIISLINQKGGVGKTTSCINIGAGLSKLGKRVLLIDMDAQGSLTVGVGINDVEQRLTIYEVLTKNVAITDVIIDNVNGLYDVVPNDLRSSAIDKQLASEYSTEYRLYDAIKELGDTYDYILIDCPPSLGILNINSLYASTEVFIPLQAEFLALNGINQLLNTITAVKRAKTRINESLNITGVITTFYDKRKRLNKEIHDNATAYFNNVVFKSKIRNCVALAEAPGNGKDIFTYAPKCNGAKDYYNLIKEIVKQERK